MMSYIFPFSCNARNISFIFSKRKLFSFLSKSRAVSGMERQEALTLPVNEGCVCNFSATTLPWRYNDGRPLSLSCMSAIAPPVKSLRTCTMSRWSCSDSRTNSCCVSASCCTDSDSSSSERDTVSSSTLVVCCSWTLSEAVCRMPSLAARELWPPGRERSGDALEEVWGRSWRLHSFLSSVTFSSGTEGCKSSFWSSSESPNAVSASWDK